MNLDTWQTYAAALIAATLATLTVAAFAIDIWQRLTTRPPRPHDDRFDADTAILRTADLTDDFALWRDELREDA